MANKKEMRRFVLHLVKTHEALPMSMITSHYFTKQRAENETILCFHTEYRRLTDVINEMVREEELRRTQFKLSENGPPVWTWLYFYDYGAKKRRQEKERQYQKEMKYESTPENTGTKGN